MTVYRSTRDANALRPPVRRLTRCVRRWLSWSSRYRPATRAAIASTGIIQDGNLLAINPQNLGGLHHFPLVQTLEDIAGLPTTAINDAQAAAWAEYHVSAKEIKDMVFLTVSTGVGAA